MHHPQEEVTVALVGKYIDLPDAYLSVAEALRAGGFAHEAKVHLRWVASDECETEAGAAKHLPDVDAVLVPGGFGIRGLEGKLGALTLRAHPRHPDPRPVPGPAVHGHRVRPQRRRDREAGSTEFDPDTVEPVISTIEEQKKFVEGAGDLGGTMRLGLQPAELAEGSVVRAAYGTGPRRGAPPPPLRVQRRLPRRPRGGRPGVLRDQPRARPGRVRRAAGRRAPLLRRDPGAPGAASRPTRPHPLFAGLIGAAIERQRSSAFPIDESGLRRKDDAED